MFLKKEREEKGFGTMEGADVNGLKCVRGGHGHAAAADAPVSLLSTGLPLRL